MRSASAIQIGSTDNLRPGSWAARCHLCGWLMAVTTVERPSSCTERAVKNAAAGHPDQCPALEVPLF